MDMIDLLDVVEKRDRVRTLEERVSFLKVQREQARKIHQLAPDRYGRLNAGRVIMSYDREIKRLVHRLEVAL